MPRDLTILLLWAVPVALVGLIIGIVLRYYFPALCERYSNWAKNLSWWAFAAFAAFFLLLAVSQIACGNYSFAVFFAGFAVFELVGMFLTIRRKNAEKDNTSKSSEKNSSNNGKFDF